MALPPISVSLTRGEDSVESLSDGGDRGAGAGDHEGGEVQSQLWRGGKEEREGATASPFNATAFLITRLHVHTTWENTIVKKIPFYSSPDRCYPRRDRWWRSTARW